MRSPRRGPTRARTVRQNRRPVEFSTPFPRFYLYYPQRRHASRALRALIDHLRRDAVDLAEARAEHVVPADHDLKRAPQGGNVERAGDLENLAHLRQSLGRLPAVVLPMPVTALLGVAACVVLRVAPAREAFAPFADPLMFLFIGAFILARGIFHFQNHLSQYRYCFCYLLDYDL